MAYKSSVPYLGFPGLAYNECIQYATHGMSHQEKKDRVGKIYAFIKAFIRMREDKENGIEIENLVGELAAELNTLETMYKPDFEGFAGYTPAESQFNISCRGVFEKEMEVMGLCRMIEKFRGESTIVPTGDD